MIKSRRYLLALRCNIHDVRGHLRTSWSLYILLLRDNDGYVHCETKDVLDRAGQSRFTIDRIVNLPPPQRDTIPWSYKPNSEPVLAKFRTNAALILPPRLAERTVSPVSHDATSRHCRDSGLHICIAPSPKFWRDILDPPKERDWLILVHLRRFRRA